MGHRLALATGIAALAAAVAPCQSTWTVGPGFHPDVNSALAVASPGDAVVVLPGTYSPFALNIGCTVRALIPGTVTIGGVWPFGAFVDVPAGQQGHLVSLRLADLRVQGSLSVDDCTVTVGRVSATNAIVVLQQCNVQVAATTAGIPAIEASGSEIVATDCTFTGANASSTFFLFPAQPAISLTASRLRGARLVLASGLATTGPPASVVNGDAASRVWLSDSTLTGDPAACTLQVGGGRHDRCVLSPSCSTVPAGFVLGVQRAGPLVSGATFSVDFLLQPGMAVGVFAAESFASQVHVELEQSLLVPASSAFALATLVADAQGVASASWQVPAGPQFVDRTAWLQGFSGFTLPLQASPLVGGIVR
jgi:hypothetical protein